MELTSYSSPKTEIKQSLIEGLGRFAKESISKGEILVIKLGHIIRENELEKYSSIIQNSQIQIHDDFYLAPLSTSEFNASMCYLNHSCEPNSGMLGNIILIAMRDIQAGEELNLDYAMVFSNDQSFQCKCRAKNCRKTITGKDWMRKDLQEKYGNYFSSYLLQKIQNSNPF